MSLSLSSLVQALGWALIHVLWQGLLVGGAAAVALLVLRAARSQVRYAVSLGGLLLCLLLPAVGVWNGLGESSAERWKHWPERWKGSVKKRLRRPGR